MKGFFVVLCYLTFVSAQKAFMKGDLLPLKVNSLSSRRTQIPIDYYSLPFCMPEVVTYDSRTMGEALLGHSFANSLYKIHMLENRECVVLGESEKLHNLPWGKKRVSEEGAPDQCRYTYEKADLNEFISAIDDEYRVNFVLDGLPSVANKYNSLSGNRYTMGFPLGYKVGKVTHLFNHLEFRIEYTESEKTKGYDEADPAKRKEYYLLGLIVTPHTIEYKNGESPVKAGCTGDMPLIISDSKEKEIVWTYGVNFKEVDIPVAQRLDRFMRSIDSAISVYSVISNAILIFGLIGLIATIIIRLFKKDQITFTEREEERQKEEENDEAEGNWKILARDVFRTPNFSSLLALACGEGARVVSAAAILLIIAFPDYSHFSKELFVSIFIVVLSISSVVSGFVSTTFYKIFNSDTHSLKPLAANKKYEKEDESDESFLPVDLCLIQSKLSALSPLQRQAILSAVLVPFAGVGMYLILTIGNAFAGSTAAGLYPVFCLFLVVLFLALPLSLIGSYIAAKTNLFPVTITSTRTERPIPPQAWEQTTSVKAFFGGMATFGGCFVQFYYFLNSIWEHKYYSTASLVITIFVLVFILSALFSIIFTYYQLAHENHKWWWSSFLCGGSSGAFFFLYSLYYATLKLHISTMFSLLFYFLFSGLISFIIFIFGGSVALVVSFIFVKKLYGAAKVE